MKYLFFLLPFILLYTNSYAKNNSTHEAFFDELADFVNNNSVEESENFIDSLIFDFGVDTAHLDYAICLCFKGYVSGYLKEDFKIALAEYHRAYNIASKLPGTDTFNLYMQAYVLARIGSIYHVTEDIKGIDYLLQSNKIFHKINNNAKIAGNFRTLATYFYNTNSSDPIVFFQELSLKYTLLDTNSTKTNLAYCYRGIAHAFDGVNNDSTLFYWEKAYHTLIEDSTATASDILNLSAGAAEYALRINRYDIAKKYTPIAYDLTNKYYGENSVISAHICFQYVQLFGAENNIDSSNYYAHKGFEIYNKQGEKYIWKINAFNHLKEIEKANGNYQKALALAHKAMFVNAPNIPEPNNTAEIIPLDSSYYSYEKLGNAIYNKLELYHLIYNKEKSTKNLELSYNTNIKLLDYFLNVHYKNSISTQGSNNSFSESVNKTIDYLLWSTCEAKKNKETHINSKTSYHYLSLLKAALLTEESNIAQYTNNSFALQGKIQIDSLRNENKKLLFHKNYDKTDSLDNRTTEEAIADNYIQLLKLKHQLKNLEIKKTKNPEFTANIDAIIANITDNEAIVDYYYNDSLFYCYIVTSDQINIIEQPVKNLEKNIEQYMRCIKTASSELIASSQELYKQLIDPVLPFISNKNKLLIIPYKTLCNIPFEALCNKKDPPLIASYTVSYNFSARYVKSSEFIGKTDQIIAFAPSFSKKTGINSVMRSMLFQDESFANLNFIDKQRNSIANLPYANEEVKLIKSIFKNQTQIIAGAKATELNFRHQVQNKQIVHIASHGYSSISNPELSGLFFHNVNDSSNNDGYLFANEISEIHLDAELVVLSACQSGKGKLENIEGTFGLPRYFFAKGVPNVIASLWNVHDEKTKDLMEAFYTHLLEDKVSYAEALRLAKLDCIKNGFLPIDWAGFVLIGN
ncbi:MAG: CHAT domain-containing protein [Salinivirgaceae bacterium]|nr:CHAT domain-containing protein [Salinivirgaceae bacterium]